MGDAGVRPAPVRDAADAAARKRILRIGTGALLAVAAAVGLLAAARPELLSQENINRAYTVLLFSVVVGFFARLFLGNKWTRGERNRLIVIAILFAAAAIFWGVFEQAGSTLTIFADESTDNRIGTFEFASSWWQSVNAALIVLLAPFFSWLWVALGRRNPSYGVKFAVGLLFAGLGFLWLVWGAQGFSTSWADYIATNRDAILTAASRFGVALDPSGIHVGDVSEILSVAGAQGVENALPAWHRVSIVWLAGVYLLHTIGELCLSPVGLSAMTKLAPARVAGQMMGVWFLGASVGNFLGGSVAGYYEKLELPSLLMIVAATAIGMALVMFLLSGPMKRMLAGSET